ncbi:MAG: DUF87 domain-containing protein [Acidaminococcaceae bacterium]|nr:DUF87 domain-containing protein [Acidaminococcaceae bacterium]
MLLHKVFGATGAMILLIVGMLAGLVLTGKISLAAMTAKAGDKIQDIRAARRERRDIKPDRDDTSDTLPAPAERKPFFRTSGSKNNSSGSMDVYNTDEFADYNEDVRKESVFTQILNLRNKKQNSGSDDNGFSDPWPENDRKDSSVPAERMANHIKEKPPLIPVYPEKQEKVVLRPASDIIAGHQAETDTAPWEKDAVFPEQSFPAYNADSTAAEGNTETMVPAADTAPRFRLTPFGVSPVTEDAATDAASREKSGTKISSEKISEAGLTSKEAGTSVKDTVNEASETDAGTEGKEDGSDVLESPRYIFPPLDLLNPAEKIDQRRFVADVKKQCDTLEKTLADFKVNAKVTGVTRGPSVTRYELAPAPGVKVSSVVNLSEDIALRLAAPGVRVEAPIPGKAAIGIEVPDITNDMVSFREIVDCEAVRNNPSKLCVGLGKDIEGNVITIDLSKMPHLLVAGTTGSGKSVCVNTLLTGIMFKARPDEVKLILVDPKVVELTNYNGIPHLLVPVVTDAKKAASALHWAVAEMERRYKSFADTRVRDIKAYNAQAEEKMPFIVIVIDEMSDLMMVAKADVEDAILRLAQKARACGIHMVLATQRPSVDVITGIVKANIPSRIAFAVSSLTDSRTILDMGGAEKLLGKGDMLFYPIGSNKPLRVQGAFVSDEELNRITDFIKEQAIPVEYSDEVTNVALPSDSQKEEKNASGNGEEADNSGQDELLEEAIRLVLELGQASSSMLQRRFRIGYNRAARLVDTMEELGIVGPATGSKPRELLMSRDEVEYRFLHKEDFGDSQ